MIKMTRSVYGANASGKSIVIKAIALLQQIANGSFPQSMVEPFKLADTEDKNSKVEIEFKSKGKCFAYGMEFTVGGIKEEWLFEINSRTTRKFSPERLQLTATSSRLARWMEMKKHPCF